MWRVEVDQSACLASGMCAALSPGLFELDDDYARPTEPAIAPDEVALDAADQCPAQAIHVYGETGEELGPRP